MKTKEFLLKHLKVIIMGTLKFREFLILFCIVACSNNNKEYVCSDVKIYGKSDNSKSNWSGKAPKNAYLFKYIKKSDSVLETYKSDTIKLTYDSINKEKFILISFNTLHNKIATKYDYRLIIDDTLEGRISDFITAPSNFGSEVSAKINNGILSSTNTGMIILIKDLNNLKK